MYGCQCFLNIILMSMFFKYGIKATLQNSNFLEYFLCIHSVETYNITTYKTLTSTY